MGAIITHFNWQFTYGNKYERFTLTNLLNLKNSTEIKFSKDAGNSIFSSQHVNDENKEDIEKIYKFFDTNSNKDGNLTYQELYDGIEEAIIASMDKKQHVNVDKVNAFFKNNGIELKNPENFLAFIKAAEEFPDLSKDAQSGYYKIDDGFNTKYEVQKDESDLSGRTYKLKNPKDGKTILANFGGQPADTQKMVSEFYAKALNNPNLEIGKISFYKKGFGEVEGATIPDINPNKLNKSAKLGLDAFFSNNETKNHISYAGTLDQTSRGLNTSFSFIPYEFPKLTENNKYNRNDIISALKTISDISDEEIKSTLKKYNNTERYEDTLLKRKEFCKIMLEQAQNTKQKKNESIKDYVERLQIYTTGKILKNIDNPADLKAFTDSADSIEDANFKQSLQELIKIKEKYMTLQELRFFSIYLAKIDQRDISTRAVRFPLVDFQKIMDLNMWDHTNHFEKTLDKLLQKIVHVPNDIGGYDTFQLFKKSRVGKDKTTNEWFVEINAHDDALKLMFEFKDKYFKYELWNVLNLESRNQVRMYEKQYENIGKREVSVEQLKKWLGIKPDDYSESNGFANFRVKVLEACQKALKEKTDIYYEFKKGKGGRGGKWLTIIFTIHKNKDYKSPVNLEAFTKICPELKGNLAKKETPSEKSKYNTPKKRKGLPSFEYKQWDFDLLRKIIEKTGEEDDDFDEYDCKCD